MVLADTDTGIQLLWKYTSKVVTDAGNENLDVFIYLMFDDDFNLGFEVN